MGRLTKRPTSGWTVDNCSSVSLEKEILRLIFLSRNENSCEPNVNFDVESVAREDGPKPMLCNVCVCSLVLPENGGSGGGKPGNPTDMSKHVPSVVSLLSGCQLYP